MTAWTADDIRVASLLEAQLGPIRVIDVIEHKENRMTDVVNPEMPIPAESWGGSDEQEMAYATGQKAIGYPELSDNPHNHTYTWSPKLPDGSMLVIRASTAEALAEAAEAVAPLAGRLRAAWQIAVGLPAAAPTLPPAMQSQPNYNPQMPPPNQPYPGQPAWQQGGAAAPAAPQWSGGQAPQGGGFGGGQQANRQGPKPRPAWPQVYKINVPFAAKDAFKAFRNDNQDALKGKVAWAGGGDYWIEGSVAQGFAQYNPMPA